MSSEKRDHNERPQGQAQRPAIGHWSPSSGASRSGSNSSSNVFAQKFSPFSKHQGAATYGQSGDAADKVAGVTFAAKSRKGSIDARQESTHKDTGKSESAQKETSPNSKVLEQKPAESVPPKAKSTSLSSYLKKVKEKKSDAIEPPKETTTTPKVEAKEEEIPKNDGDSKELNSEKTEAQPDQDGKEGEKTSTRIPEDTLKIKSESPTPAKEPLQKEDSRSGSSLSKRRTSTLADINTSPLSQLSSEMNSTTSPQKSRTQRYISDDEDDDELSDVDDTLELNRTPRRDRVKVNVEDDSDAETVHGGSPTNLTSDRYIAKDDNPSDASDKTNKEDSNNHKRIIQERLDRRSASKSSSPHRLNTKKIKTARDSQGRLKLQKVCEKGDYEQAKTLIEQGADVNDSDYAGNTALHEAALQGHTDVVGLLLENGADPNKQTGAPDLDTPLIDAAASMDTPTIEMLLKYGADPSKQNTNGDNAFDSVLEDENADHIKDLMRSAFLKLKEQAKDSLSLKEHTKYGKSFIDMATKEGRSELYCNALIGDQVFVGKHLGLGGKPDKSSLGVAAKFGNYDIVNLFLAFGCNADSYDADGTTPLMNSVGKGHMDVVRLLLDSGANPSKRSKDGISVLEFAKDSLARDEDEIKLIKERISAKSGPHENSDNRDGQKKRKSSSREDLLDTTEKRKQQKQSLKSLHEHKQKGTKIKPKESIKVKHSGEENLSARKDYKDHKDHKDHIDAVKHREKPHSKHSQEPTKPIQPEKDNISHKPESSTSKPEPMKKTNSGNITTSGHVEEPTEHLSKPEPIPHVETEEEKQARLLKAKEEQKKREEFEAAKTAKRKEREMQFLMDFEHEEQKKEEEMKKLVQLKEEQRLKELKENEAKAKLEEEKRIIMSQKEETERRKKIRELYPYGLQQATFDANRTKEDALKYLPLYFFDKEGTKYCCDIQAIMIVGIENFYIKFPEFLESRIELTPSDKLKYFNYVYPFLGNFNLKSVDKQRENHKEEFQKFRNLSVHWIKYDDFLNVLKETFAPLYDVVANRSLEIILSSEPVAATEEKKPKIQEDVKDTSSLTVPEKSVKLPYALRNRSHVEKVLLRSKKLW